MKHTIAYQSTLSAAVQKPYEWNVSSYILVKSRTLMLFYSLTERFYLNVCDKINLQLNWGQGVDNELILKARFLSRERELWHENLRITFETVVMAFLAIPANKLSFILWCSKWCNANLWDNRRREYLLFNCLIGEAFIPSFVRLFTLMIRSKDVVNE